ncbi:MAG: SPFH domain-containing protein [Planctomycetota bacterium]
MLRLLVVGLGLVAVTALLSTVSVRSAQAVVLTRFGEPRAVHLTPGLHWRAPPPIDAVQHIDMRLRSTSSGMYSTQLADGSIVIIEAFLVWRVAQDHDGVLSYLRATGARPRAAAAQLRGALGSSIQTVSGSFAMSDLVNTDASGVRLGDFEAALRARLDEQVGRYGVSIIDVGLERMMVPEPIVRSTIQAMIEERKVLAQHKRSEGTERSGAIMSTAYADGRRIVAEAKADASRIEAEGRREAAEIHAGIEARDPDLYRYLRGIEALRQLFATAPTLVLSTEAYPLQIISDGPPDAASAQDPEAGP